MSLVFVLIMRNDSDTEKKKPFPGGGEGRIFR